ncbi:hypothetical protein CABS01_01859 [Colletotrichum abscissum]|uniref:Uncharacterized protein n=4 Tax=Colletotrichum acutatum species complex TaxID=2707335 RepID=A0A9Q8WJ00_9PEZI|nr:uncharacterized protein CLUP02_10552 [Colletotrichum lupini]XP_060388209.1 uncharacterized protein CTAM01_00699 [Colletotrichum tamarilloi]XP_060398427.1 uncharacterized protein CABS01_01859 [Colletotrichum abscissum]KAI3531063.1 hypothetical protein CSPX01_14381 [Colletotrichum filicis]KXH32177.1 hypothetical protein CSIM01_05846 [Colletotrichum simmondsii]KAK1496052.1 hypothetical protein CABS01_01859 [Colletotrichum abscissum]KAK1511769.1 hypothetical protein CTAM01_00699 [Colletotrichu
MHVFPHESIDLVAGDSKPPSRSMSLTEDRLSLDQTFKLVEKPQHLQLFPRFAPYGQDNSIPSSPYAEMARGLMELYDVRHARSFEAPHGQGRLTEVEALCWWVAMTPFYRLLVYLCRLTSRCHLYSFQLQGGET